MERAEHRCFVAAAEKKARKKARGAEIEGVAISSWATTEATDPSSTAVVAAAAADDDDNDDTLTSRLPPTPPVTVTVSTLAPPCLSVCQPLSLSRLEKRQMPPVFITPQHYCAAQLL